MLFVDFSSSFNTVKLMLKLHELGLPTSLCHWIRDSQVVRIGDSTSSPMVLNTGTLQGFMLSPALLTLCTHDCTAIHSTLVKFADDTTVGGFILHNNETHYGKEIQQLTQWCSANNLVLNVGKTKEVSVDFRRSRKHGACGQHQVSGPPHQRLFFLSVMVWHSSCTE